TWASQTSEPLSAPWPVWGGAPIWRRRSELPGATRHIWTPSWSRAPPEQEDQNPRSGARAAAGSEGGRSGAATSPGGAEAGATRMDPATAPRRRATAAQVGAPPCTRGRTRRGSSRFRRSGALLQLPHHLVDDLEALAPEVLGADVDAQLGEEPLGRVAAAGREERLVLGDEGGALLAVHAVEREAEQHAEAVAVAVEGARVDVRDVLPLALEVVGHLHGAELLAQLLQVDLVEVAGGGALLHEAVRLDLEDDEVRLAHDGGVDLAHLLR